MNDAANSLFMKTIKVKVTQEHINEGVPGKPCKCPIALAIREQGNEDVSVSPWNVAFFLPNGDKLYYRLPYEAQQFIKNFDSSVNRIYAKPFEFELSEEYVKPHYVV